MMLLTSSCNNLGYLGLLSNDGIGVKTISVAINQIQEVLKMIADPICIKCWIRGRLAAIQNAIQSFSTGLNGIYQAMEYCLVQAQQAKLRMRTT